MNSIITDNLVNEQKLNSRIDRFFNEINISKLLLRSNFYKESGFQCSTVLKELFSLVFHGKNLYRTLSVKKEELPFKKNTAYRFLNSSHFNWEKLLFRIHLSITCCFVHDYIDFSRFNPIFMGEKVEILI